MAIVNSDVLRTTMVFKLEDDTVVQNIFHHKASIATSVGDGVVLSAVEAWATDTYSTLLTFAHGAIAPLLASLDVVAWDGLKWEVIRNVGSFLPEFAPSDVTDPMPNQVSPFVTFKTARPKTRGKKFLFPMTEQWYFGSTLDPSLVAALTAFGAKVLGDIILVAVDKLIPGVPRSTVDAFFEFVLSVVTNVVGSQRRRRPGVGI